MTDAFADAQTVEQQSLRILQPFIQQRAFNGRYAVTSKGPLARDLQKTVGDVVFNSDDATLYSIEIKAEQENKHGNFFLETWSNLSRLTPGWMVTLKADLLFWHFIDNDLLYPIPFRALQVWAFNDRRIYCWPEKRQSKRSQLNDTWGRCVPIDVLVRDLKLPQPFQPRRVALAAK